MSNNIHSYINKMYLNSYGYYININHLIYCNISQVLNRIKMDLDLLSTISK